MILLLYLFTNCIDANSQVVPHGLMHHKAYTETSIFADAQFRLYYNTNGGKNTNPNPSIKSDFSFNFNNNTPYTFQFQYSVFDEGTQFWHEFEIPLIGFTNESSLDTATAIFLYSFKSYFTNRYSLFANKVNKIVPYVLYSNKDWINNVIGTTDPFNSFSSGVITTVYNGQSWKNYKNGILVGEIINTTIWNGSGNLIIGYGGTRNPQHDVLNLFYDEIRFWNRALSPDEITNNWNKSLRGDETGLQVYYNFNHQGYPSYLRWNNSYYRQPSFDFNNNNVKYLNDLSPNKFKGTFLNCELQGFTNNFYKMTSDTYYNFDSLIFHFDANNVDSYPGSGKYNNTLSIGKWYNLFGFNNNLQFYTSTNYNQFVQPIYNIEKNITRSFHMNNIYGKSALNTGISGDMDIAIEAWVKFNNNNNNSIVKFGENYERKKIEIGVTNNKFSLNIGTIHPLLSNTNLISNKWYHLVFAYSNITFKYKIYINGILDKDEWIDPIIGYVDESVNFWEGLVGVRHNITNTPLYIGTIETPFNGKIALLKLYKRSFNNTEIRQKYLDTKARFGY